MSSFYNSTSTTTSYYTTCTANDGLNSLSPDDWTKMPENLKKETIALPKCDNEAIEKILADESAMYAWKTESVILFFGPEQDKFVSGPRARVLPYYGINSGLIRYTDLFSMKSSIENTGFWINYLLFDSKDRVLDVNLFRYMYYISYYRRGGYPKPSAMIILEATPEEVQAVREFAPDAGLSIESIVEMIKLSNNKLLIKVLGKWNLKKR